MTLKIIILLCNIFSSHLNSGLTLNSEGELKKKYKGREFLGCRAVIQEEERREKKSN